MTNVVILMGRLTQAPELKTTSSGNSVLSFTIAVERDYCAKGEERKVDFIKCTAWRNTADFICKYFQKGSLILVQGTWQTSVYDDQNGERRYSHFCNVDKASFTGEKRENNGGNNGNNGGYQQQNNGNNSGYQQRNNGNNGGYQKQNNGNNAGYQQQNNGNNGGYQQQNNGNNGGYQQRNNGNNGGYQNQGTFPDEMYPEDEDLPFY